MMDIDIICLSQPLWDIQTLTAAVMEAITQSVVTFTSLDSYYTHTTYNLILCWTPFITHLSIKGCMMCVILLPLVTKTTNEVRY